MRRSSMLSSSAARSGVKSHCRTSTGGDSQRPLHRAGRILVSSTNTCTLVINTLPLLWARQRGESAFLRPDLDSSYTIKVICTRRVPDNHLETNKLYLVMIVARATDLWGCCCFNHNEISPIIKTSVWLWFTIMNKCYIINIPNKNKLSGRHVDLLYQP